MRISLPGVTPMSREVRDWNGVTAQVGERGLDSHAGCCIDSV
jgi:hypothetical protein